MWLRRTRLTLFVALLLSLVILAWLAGHPRLYSGHIGRMVTRHLLADLGLTFSCQDIAGNPLSALRFYGVIITRDGAGGEFAYLSCDSLDVRYELNSLFDRRLVVPELTLHTPRLALRRSAAAPAKAPTPAEPARRFGGGVWDLEIARLRLRNGEVDLQGGPTQRNFRALELEAALSLRAGTTRLRIEDLALQWPEGAYHRIHLRADSELRDSKLQVQELVAQLDSLELRGDANVDFASGEKLRWDARISAAGFDLGPLMSLLGKKSPVELQVDAAVELRRDEQLSIEGNGTGTLLHYPFALDHFAARVHGDGMEIDVADGEFQGATVSVGGSLDTHNKFLRLSGSVSGFDLSREWKEGESGWPQSDIEGQATLDLELQGDEELRIDIRHATGSVHGIEVDSLRTELRILPASGVEIRSGRGLANGSAVTATGSIDPEGLADLELRALSADAERWMSARWPQWHLRGVQARGRLAGPIQAARLEVEGSAASAFGPQLQGEGLHFALSFSALDRPENVEGRASCDSLALRELPPGRAQIRFARVGQHIEIPEFSLARGDSVLGGKGSAELIDGLAELQLDSLALELGEVAWHLDQPSTLRVGPHRLGSPHFQMVGERGSLLLAGDADLQGSFDLALTLHDMDLSLLRWAGLSPFDCAGVLNGSLALEGDSRAPLARLDFELRDGQWRELRADTLRAQLVAEGNTLRVNFVELHDPRGRLRAGGTARFADAEWLAAMLDAPGTFLDHWPSAAIEATIAAQDVELDRWLPETMSDQDQSWGELRARLDLYGTAREPRIAGDVTLVGLRNSAIDVPELYARVESDAAGLRLRNGVVATDHPWIEFEGEYPLAISAAERPRRLPGDGLQLRLSSPGDVDLAPLATLIPAIEEAKGSGRFVFVARGNPRQPELSGEITAHASLLRFRDLSEEFRDVEVAGLFHDQVLELNRVRARQGERGELDATGKVRFDGLTPDDIEASIQVSRMLLITVPELRAIVSSVGQLQLKMLAPFAGGPRIPHVSGRLLVDRARYVGEFTGAAGGEASVLTATSTPPWMADLRIALRDQIRISNSVAELLVTGDIDLQRDLSGLRLRGVAEVATGRVSVARLLDFEITEGRLDFSRGRNLEPAVEIRAETEVPVYEENGVGRELEHVTVRMTGTFARPILAFDSASGYDEKTIINLLAGIPVDSGTAEEAQLQALALRMAGKELTGALSDRIGGIDTIDLQPADPGAEGNRARIGLGKYLDVADKPLYLRYTQGFSISERDVYLEYQLRRRFLLTFEVRRRLREAVTHTELNADLKFRVEY